MILAYAVVLLVVLALLLRRDISAIGQVPVRGGKKMAAVVVGLFVLQATSVIYAPGQNLLQMAILILSQIALAFLILLNHHLPGAKLFAIGIILNLAVMAVNGGWMPVTPSTYKFVHPEQTVEVGVRPPASKNIILPHEETNLWFLSDIIPVILPWRRWAVSLGDVFLIIGAALFIFQTTSKKGEATTRGTIEGRVNTEPTNR